MENRYAPCCSRQDGDSSSRRPISPVEDGEGISPYPDTQGASIDSSWVTLTYQPADRQTDKLTVQRKWKVEQELAQRIRQMNGPSRLVPIAKWIFTILMAAGITVLFIATKVTFVSLSLALNSTCPLSGPTESADSLDEWAAYVGQFLVLYLVLAVPYFLLLLRSAWAGLFTKENPWPSTSGVMMCLVVGILEPLGLIIMALKVLPKLPMYLGVLTLCTVASLSIFLETGRVLRQPGKRSAIVAKVASSLCMLAGLGTTFYMIYVRVQNPQSLVKDLMHLLVAVVCLNIAWLPRLLRSCCETRCRPEGHDGMTASSIFSVNESSTDTNDSSASVSTQELIEVPRLAEPTVTVHSATWKASFIIYFVKTLSTLIISFLVFYIDSDFLSTNFNPPSHWAFLSAWAFASKKFVGYTWASFGVNLTGALICYVMVFIASHTNTERGCLTLPYILSLPLTISLTAARSLCLAVIGDGIICENDSPEWYFVLGATVSFTLAQTLSFGRYSVRKEKIYLRKEHKLFWIPGYNAAITDSYLLLNSRQSIREGRVSTSMRSKSDRTQVYICTTMYREDKDEMRQLLESVARINLAQAEGETIFQSHIVLDGGIQQGSLSEFSWALIFLLEDTLGVSPRAATKIITPYGMKLSWKLPKSEMLFNIHLKDNTLVKNKKRWSQIMYMSYVLDYLPDTGVPDCEKYILTTDADVMFTPESVVALLDLMSRDASIGAVCARTHPMGHGPLVWYQIFEYAIGHWFHKAAEHVLGSVMCAPGCFSVYRCRALQDVLPKYCKKVESAFDFLTKDMGEDRWMCTLLVQSGWRIEYCAASENSTNCPSRFDEFFKQRRRWIASTLANLMLIIKEWKYIGLFNHRVSVVFMLYQALLLFATLISPSTVLLVVAGGLDFAWGVNWIASLILQLILCISFALVCIFTAEKTQLLTAKLYTFLYAVVMCAVAIGTAEQVVLDLSDVPETVIGNTTLIGIHMSSPQHISPDVPISTTTGYLLFLVSIFLVAGLLHPREITCLIHGGSFLLCVPAANLVLIIYSVCNLTDSSWGTREVILGHTTDGQRSWSECFKQAFYTIFFCLTPKSVPGIDAETQTVSQRFSGPSTVGDSWQPSFVGDDQQATSVHMSFGDEQTQSDFWDHSPEEAAAVPVPVDKWLHPDFRGEYAEIFKKHGYDNTCFIKSLTGNDLTEMGINKMGHVQFLSAEIARLPAFEIKYQVPSNVETWLLDIGLSEYIDNFRRNRIQTPEEMEILKRFDRKEIASELGITKEGHVRRLMEAIRKFRDSSESQQKSHLLRQAIVDIPAHNLKETDPVEHEFWIRLRETCLMPDLKVFAIDAEIKANLVKLRNSWLTVLAVVNTLWLILITTLATKADLIVLGSNALGLIFLVIFGFVFLVQFLAMLAHRVATLCHYIARAPWTFGRPLLTVWSFKDRIDNTTADPADVTVIHETRKSEDEASENAAEDTAKRTWVPSRKIEAKGDNHKRVEASETTPLLSTDRSNCV